MRSASAGVKRPCISTRISTSGPTRVGMASISPIERIALGALQLVVARPERIDLQRSIAALDHHSCRGVRIPRRALDRVPAVGVGLDAVAHRAAEQLVDRHAERLALDVQAGDLEHRRAGHSDLAHARVVVAHQPLHEVLRLERVAAQHVARHALFEVPEQRLVWPSMRTSPTPDNPSSVLTLTIVRFRHGVPSTNVWTSLMRTRPILCGNPRYAPLS